MRFARKSRCCPCCARWGGHPERSRGTWVCGGTPIVPPARGGPSTTLGMTRENRAMSDEPYFTVLAHDKFRRANLTPAAEQEFFASGDEYGLDEIRENEQMLRLLRALGMTRENRAMSDEPYFTVLAHDKFRRATLTPPAEQE